MKLEYINAYAINPDCNTPEVMVKITSLFRTVYVKNCVHDDGTGELCFELMIYPASKFKTHYTEKHPLSRNN